MKQKISLSIEESTLSEIDNRIKKIHLENPKKYLSRSKMICAHAERSLKIPCEVTI